MYDLFFCDISQNSFSGIEKDFYSASFETVAIDNSETVIKFFSGCIDFLCSVRFLLNSVQIMKRVFLRGLGRDLLTS